MKRTLGLALAVLVLGGVSARANDGYAGIGVSGLEFGDSDAIAMESEDLYLSRSKVEVKYVFRNTSRESVEALVAFQLPPFAPADSESDSALSEQLRAIRNLNYVDFSAEVDGKPVTLDVEVRYFLPKSEDYEWGLARLENPGPEVTARLEALDVPQSFDLAAIKAWYDALPRRERDALVEERIFEVNYMGTLMPRYWLSVRFYWTQVFKPGRRVAVRHTYTPVLGGSVFYIGAEATEAYCIDAGTRRAIDRLAARADGSNGREFVMLDDLQYVLTTAHTWKGPIGHFRLTVDKEDANDVISLCADDVEKTGPTTFVVERDDYVPAGDIRVLFVNLERAN